MIVLLFLFVVFNGIAVGAGIYEMRINVPRWFLSSGQAGTVPIVDADAMQKDDVGRRFWGFVATGPLTLLTIGNLVAAWQTFEPFRVWWLAAAAIVLLERMGTFAYFIPNAIRLMKPGALPAARASALAAQWTRANYIRLALSMTGWLAALKALSMTG